MRGWFGGVVAVVALAVLTGCASSERMTRMSGGVFEDKSTPEACRMSSAEWSAKAPEAKSEPRLAAYSDTLVNAFPVFVRNPWYWSALWPMIDCDDYGFAVRPFFNQEADEYAILFPLSAWNPVNGDGWAGIVGWSKGGVLIFPVAYIWSDGSVWVLNSYFDRDAQTVFPLFLNQSRKGYGWVANCYWGKNSFGVLPLLHWEDGGKSGMVLPVWWGETSWGAFPLVWMTPEVDVLAPVWWRSNAAGLFPLFRQGWGKDAGTSYFFPLYGYNDHGFVSALGGWGRDRDGRLNLAVAPAAAYVYSTECKEHLWEATEITAFGIEESETRNVVESETQVFGYLGWYRRQVTVANESGVIDGLVRVQAEGFSPEAIKEVGDFGFWKGRPDAEVPANQEALERFSIEYLAAAERKEKESLLIFPLLYWERSPGYRLWTSSLLFRAETDEGKNAYEYHVLGPFGFRCTGRENAVASGVTKERETNFLLICGTNATETRRITLPGTAGLYRLLLTEGPGELASYPGCKPAPEMVAAKWAGIEGRQQELDLWHRIFGDGGAVATAAERQAAATRLEERLGVAEVVDDDVVNLFPLWINSREQVHTADGAVIRDYRLWCSPALLSGFGRDEKSGGLSLLLAYIRDWQTRDADVVPVFERVGIDAVGENALEKDNFVGLLGLGYVGQRREYLQWRADAPAGVAIAYDLLRRGLFWVEIKALEQFFAESEPALREAGLLTKPLAEYKYADLKSLAAAIRAKYTETVPFARDRYLAIMGGRVTAGDEYAWDVLGVLARGERSKQGETLRVLEWLYRSDRTPERVNRFIFPFITVQQEHTGGVEQERIAFLWRLVNLEYRDGALTGGHLFFFPF